MRYIKKPRKVALVFEVFLPKKMQYASKLAEVLDSFVTEDAILNVPGIKEIVDRHVDDPPAQRERFAERIRSIVSGCSLYEVDGRFATEDKLVDERVWVVRFIFHDPSNDEGMDASFRQWAELVIEHLIAKRFAIELGTEDEVWVLEYENCFLRRWVAEKEETPAAAAIEPTKV